ncbi:unnamed protein product [Bathycoccus prasinos]
MTNTNEGGGIGESGFGTGETALTATNESNKQPYPTSAKEYQITDEIGRGVSGVVWKATIPSKQNEQVAIKVLDLEDQDQNYLEEIRREAQTMSMLSHPNLVRYYCSFIEKSSLWVVMPYLEGGSVLNLMKWKHLTREEDEERGEGNNTSTNESVASTSESIGLDETTVATILKGTLKALDYFHRNGNIHRDVKAGNILVDANGDVKLADFGVSASSWGSGGRPRSHQTFVGTPCWMAPEVMEQVSGYDFHADIWSLGITVLELCHGHAPFAKYPPMKVLLMTLQNPPPTLESSAQSGAGGVGGGPKKTFSRALKEFVGLCLQKDPSKRPSAEKLLEHRFLKEAKKSDYIVKTLLKDIPSLGERTKQLLERDAKRREAKRKGEDIGKTAEQEEAESQAAYKHGVSMWNFNLDELKAEAAAIDNEVGGGDPSAKSSLQKKGSRFKIIEEENSGAGSDSGASTQSAKIEQKGRFTVSDDTPAQQQEQQQPPQPQRKVTKKGRFIVEEEHNVAASSSQRSSGGIGASEIEQMCEKMVLFSRQQDDVIRSLREENESLRRRVAELGG